MAASASSLHSAQGHATTCATSTGLSWCQQSCGHRSLGSPASPLLELGGHSHWVWRAKFNPSYDSLLLSASSDSLVNLWHTPVIAGQGSSQGQRASRGPSKAGPKGFGKEAYDGKACTYDDHEDSVYGKHITFFIMEQSFEYVAATWKHYNMQAC